MGWSGNHNRAEYVAKTMKGWSCPTGEKVTVRKHHASGVEDWLILDVENPDGTKGAFISMMVWDGGMVKHMDETAFPYYYGCPVEWLDEVPCPDSEMASDWRMQLKGTPVHRCESCHELGCAGHALELVVLSAWGDWAEGVPKGMVGVGACFGGRVNGGYASPMQYFLVKKEEYQARGRMFVVDPKRHEEWVNSEHPMSKQVARIQ